MIRKSLCRDIQLVNQRLNLRQETFQRTKARSNAALQQLNPYLRIGVGLLAGIMTSIVGWRKIYTFVGASFNFYPSLIK